MLRDRCTSNLNPHRTQHGSSDTSATVNGSQFTPLSKCLRGATEVTGFFCAPEASAGWRKGGLPVACPRNYIISGKQFLQGPFF